MERIIWKSERFAVFAHSATKSGRPDLLSLFPSAWMARDARTRWPTEGRTGRAPGRTVGRMEHSSEPPRVLKLTWWTSARLSTRTLYETWNETFYLVTLCAIGALCGAMALFLFFCLFLSIFDFFYVFFSLSPRVSLSLSLSAILSDEILSICAGRFSRDYRRFFGRVLSGSWRLLEMRSRFFEILQCY